MKALLAVARERIFYTRQLLVSLALANTSAWDQITMAVRADLSGPREMPLEVADHEKSVDHTAESRLARQVCGCLLQEEGELQ